MTVPRARPGRIAVAGCGPAGLAAALLLARDGHGVTLFERFDAPRPVGSGLMIQPTGLAVLQALGLDGAIVRGGARIDRLFGRAMPSGRTVLDVRYAALGPRHAPRQAQAFGVGIHRAALFDALHGAVLAEGIPIRTGHAIEGIEGGAGGRWLRVAGLGRVGPFDLVVDALGTGSPLPAPCGRTLPYGALWATLDWPGAGFDPAALEQRYVRASRMVGVLPIGAGRAAFFWSLRVDQLGAWRAAGLAPWKDDVRALWPETAPLLDAITAPEQLTFARYAHRTVRRPAAAGVVQIGDAWHSASPQLGQGANMALLDAYALALALREAPARDGPARAISLRRRHVQLYQLMSTLFTPAYQSDGRVLPFVRDQVIGALIGVRPAAWVQAMMVSGLVGGPLRPLGLHRGPVSTQDGATQDGGDGATVLRRGLAPGQEG